MSKSPSNSGFLEFVFNLHQEIDKHEVILSYEGDINHHIMKSFTDMVEENMSKAHEPEALQIKVYHVMVECLQNINKHGVHPDNESDLDFNRGIFLLTRDKQEYIVTTGNYIKKEKISQLTKFLDNINSLPKKQLNELYKKQLKEGHLSEKGGAGLGFIDIRRKTGNQLECQFIHVSDSHAFFLFTSKIPRTS